MSGVRRVMANNLSLFTFKGTISFIIKLPAKSRYRRSGSDDPVHISALLDAVRGRR